LKRGMSSRTPRVAIRSRSGMMLFFSAPLLCTSVGERSLYIFPSKKCASASHYVARCSGMTIAPSV
jgi:hypothetical protein